ncbi:MAG: methyltransferase domain-containing protein [Candidatus Asgardarchaeia archaeon]
MGITESIYDKIVCPVCNSRMKHFGDHFRGSLYCRKCDVYYPINEGIPSLIPKFDLDYWKTLRKISKFYDKYSHFHDVNYDNPSMEYMRGVERKVILKNLRGNMALDLGCGTGRYTELLLSKGFNVVSVDISKEMLKVTKKRVEGKYDGKFFLLQCDVGLIPFKERIFDTILGIFGPFNHTPYYLMGFEKLSSLLKRDGVAIISVLNSFDVRKIFNILISEKKLRAIEEFNKGRDGYLLMRAGKKGARLYTHFFGYGELKEYLMMYFSKVRVCSVLSLVKPEFKRSDRKVGLIDRITYVIEDTLRWHFPLDRLGTYLIAVVEEPK